MTKLSKQALFWTPRVLAIAYICFLSLFALEAFGEGHGFSGTLLALTIHLIPNLVLIAGLVVAWRWEWIGASLYAAAGMLYISWVLRRPLSPAIKLTWIVAIAGPALLVAALFLANWLKHGELHARQP